MLNSIKQQSFIDFIENFPGFVSVRDKESRIVFANSRFKQLFSMENTIDVIGYTNKELAPKVSKELACVLDICHDLENTFIEDRRLNNKVVKCVTNNGVLYIDILKFKGFESDKNHIITFGKDITQIYDEIVYHKNRSYTDPLTNLGNRKLLNDSIFNIGDVFIYIDLDNFKSVNDTYGHVKGDEILIALSDILKTLFGDEIIIRMGGDEFLIVIKKATLSKMNIEKVIKKLRQQFRIAFSNYPLLDISLGYSEFNNNIDQTLKIIDQRMYQDKKYKSARLV